VFSKKLSGALCGVSQYDELGKEHESGYRRKEVG
jgi:hypothetical protein